MRKRWPLFLAGGNPFLCVYFCLIIRVGLWGSDDEYVYAKELGDDV